MANNRRRLLTPVIYSMAAFLGLERVPYRRRAPLANPPMEEAYLSWRALGAEVVRNRFGPYVTARQWYATPAMCEPDRLAMELLLHSRAAANHVPKSHASDPEKWLFLDTEATGFIGGSGNLAFLIGLAWWDSGGIQIEQLFMRDAAEEYSILFELRRRIRKRPVLVTFNGKSFDWPLLVSRFQMTRAIAVPVLKAHLDFLHPAREIWKLQIGSVKLGHLEERVLGAESLGWSRSEDIDSALIPGIYFDYVYGRSHRLEGVFRHNRMDLRGLAALAGRILQMLSHEWRPQAGNRSRAPRVVRHGAILRQARPARHCSAILPMRLGGRTTGDGRAASAGGAREIHQA
jgi:uncharacterized protein